MLRIRTYNNLARDFAEMAESMNRTLGRGVPPYDYAANGGSTGENGQHMRLPLDVWADENAFTITAYLPGVDMEEVEITFEGEELRIAGRFPQVGEERSYIKSELFHGAFERRLTFNVAVDADAIEATYEHGVLTLAVPKAEEVRPKQIKVQSKS